MQWVALAVVLGCARLSPAARSPTPTPTSTHTPLVDNSEEEVDEPCFEPCTCEVKEGVLHVHCDGRSFTNVSQVRSPPAAHVEPLHCFIAFDLISERRYNILSLMWLMGVSDQICGINEINNQASN